MVIKEIADFFFLIREQKVLNASNKCSFVIIIMIALFYIKQPLFFDTNCSLNGNVLEMSQHVQKKGKINSGKEMST